MLAVVAVSGTASAFWTAYGQGFGSAATETAGDVTLSPAVPTAQLYPGGSSDVVLTISNSSSASVHIGSLAVDVGQGTGGFSADAAHGACGLSSLAFTTATNSGAGWTIPGAVDGTAGTSGVSLPSALSMMLDAPNGCQGANITIYLAAGQ